MYFRTRVFPDALSTLCGCPSVPLYDALRPIHTGMRDACISNNLGCVLLQAGKPHCALLLLQRSCSPALPSSPTSAESEEADTRAVACSEDFHGSLRHRDTAAAYYNEALVLLKLQQPLPALALLQAISKQEDPLAQRPHLHIRKAECIMLHHHLLRSAMASKPIEVQQVGSGLSEKFLLRYVYIRIYILRLNPQKRAECSHFQMLILC